MGSELCHHSLVSLAQKERVSVAVKIWMAEMERKRKPNWSRKENLLLVDEEHQKNR